MNEEQRRNQSFLEHAALREEITPAWDYSAPTIVKYVDNILGSEKLFLNAGKTHITTKRTKILLHAHQSEQLIEAITKNAAELGLKVNAKKHK